MGVCAWMGLPREVGPVFEGGDRLETRGVKPYLGGVFGAQACVRPGVLPAEADVTEAMGRSVAGSSCVACKALETVHINHRANAEVRRRVVRLKRIVWVTAIR